MAILVAIGDDEQFETVLEVATRLSSGRKQRLTVAHVTANDAASATVPVTIVPEAVEV